MSKKFCDRTFLRFQVGIDMEILELEILDLSSFPWYATTTLLFRSIKNIMRFQRNFITSRLSLSFGRILNLFF